MGLSHTPDTSPRPRIFFFRSSFFVVVVGFVITSTTTVSLVSFCQILSPPPTLLVKTDIRMLRHFNCVEHGVHAAFDISLDRSSRQLEKTKFVSTRCVW
jgi:hypothetical protein